jgi:hypothetical protein
MKWHQQDDLNLMISNILLNKYIKICHGKVVQWNVLHYFIIV